jgi:hypothetical protein
MLDIYDINYEFCSESLGNLNFPSAILPRKGIFFRILSQFKGAIKYSLKSKNNKYLEKNSVLFFVFAQNEINSVQSIASELSNSKLFGIDDYKNGYPISKIYWYSLIFIPIVLYRFLICKNTYHKRSFSYAFDGFCIAYSSKYVLKKYLATIEPTKIIIANQLSCYHRSLAYVAKDLNIETVYIQHASITKNFSDINMFSSALLEGEDSLSKYQSNGTVGKKIFLIGMSKFDKYFSKISRNKIVNSIGICTNGMDDLKAYSDLITLLNKKFPEIKIIVRPHPADRRKQEWYDLAKNNDCSFSDVFLVESFLFFEDVNLIIAGDSNIHLEAALLNIPSIYFDPLGKKVDWYGFASNQLVYYAGNSIDIINIIHIITEKFPDTRSKTKFYSESVNTKFDGKSSKLAAMILNGENENVYFEMQVDQNKNEIYRIK